MPQHEPSCAQYHGGRQGGNLEGSLHPFAPRDLLRVGWGRRFSEPGEEGEEGEGEEEEKRDSEAVGKENTGNLP